MLHILNGDATAKPFIETGLDGDVMVWREVFSEGPLAKKLDADFWNMRSDFICDAFDDNVDGYDEKVIQELGKLNKPYTEINLWFEFDLHCQVNMLGVMQLLKQQVDLSEPAIYLICPDSVEGVENFRGMGELNAGQLEDLYDTRLHLTEYDFTLANEAWQLYIARDAEKLQQWLDNTPFWGSLHLLKPALQAQVKRLWVNEDGLSYIEQKLLFLYQQGNKDRDSLYNAFWTGSPIYGMGDAELDIYLNRLIAKNLVNVAV